MPSRYRVVAPLAVAIVNGRRVRYDRGAVLPEAADATQAEHLLSQGLIEVIDLAEPSPTPDVEPTPAPTPEPAPAVDGQPAVDITGFSLGQLRDYAAAQGIDLGGAQRKDEVRAVITAAQA